MITSEAHGFEYPRDINYRADPNICVPAAFAYVMFCIDAPTELWRPEAMDALTGRKPGELTYDNSLLIGALLDQEAVITEINKFDNSRFIADGLAYLEEYHATGWLKATPNEFYGYWSPERLATQQEFTARHLERVKTYGQQYKVVKSQPTVEQVDLKILKSIFVDRKPLQ